MKSQTRNTQRMCKRHPDEKARYYCHTCHDFICRECTVLDHPKPDHKYTSVADGAKRYKETVSNKLSEIAKVRDDFQESKDIALKKAADIEKESATALAQLRIEAAELRAQIDKIEKEQSDEIERVRQQRSDKVQDHVSELETIRERACHIYETVQKIIVDGSDDEFLSLYPTFDSKMEQLSKEKPTSIDMDGAYMAYNRMTSRNIEMGKLEVPEFEEWKITKEFDDGNEFCSVDLYQNGDVVALNIVKEKPAVAIFNASGELKHKFETQKDGAAENHSKFPSDLCITPDGSIAVFKYYSIDIYQTTGTFLRRVVLKLKERFTQPTDTAATKGELSPSTTSDLPDSTVEKHDDSDKTHNSADVSNNEPECGSIKVITYQKEHHFLASFCKHKYIGFYHFTSGNLAKRIDVNFHPFRIAVLESDSFVVTDSGIHGKVFLMNTNGEVINAMTIPSETGFSQPLGVCYDLATAQIYVSAIDQEEEACGILQYSRSGLFLGSISTKVEAPLDIQVIGSNKIAIADGDDIKILVKT